MAEAVEDVMRGRAAHGFRDALFEPVDEIGAHRAAVQRGGGETARLVVSVDIGIGRIARIPRHLPRRQVCEAAHIAARRDRVDAVRGSKGRIGVGRAAHHARGPVAHAVIGLGLIARRDVGVGDARDIARRILVVSLCKGFHEIVYSFYVTKIYFSTESFHAISGILFEALQDIICQPVFSYSFSELVRRPQ